MEEKVSVQNKSGLKLSTILNRPKGSGSFPIVILLVGFTGYKEWLPMEMLAKSLAENGIGVVRFDPSGFGESEGSLEKDYRFSNYVSDAQMVFNYVENLNWVDKEKIGVFGQSAGGIQALILSANNRSKVKALVLVSSPTILGSDDDLNGKYRDWEKNGYLEKSTTKYGKLKIPFEFIKDAGRWNGLDYLKDVNSPMLVAWCSNDTNVPPRITKQIYDKAMVEKEFKELKNSDHFMNRDPKVIEVMVNMTVIFFIKKLK